MRPRLLPLRIGERSLYYIQQNRGKKSLCVDFAKPEALELLADLAAGADIVVENFGPGVLEKRGLGYAALAKRNPRLVMASISAFGRTGPLANKAVGATLALGHDDVCKKTGCSTYLAVLHSIPPADQMIVEQINKEWIEKQGKVWDSIDEEGRAWILNRGNKIGKLESEEMNRWLAKAQPLFDEYVNNMKAKGLPGEEVLKFARDYLQANTK